MNADMIALWRTLAPDACLDTAELSKALGVSLRAIHGRAEAGTLPPPVFLGGKSRTDTKRWNTIGTRGVPMNRKHRWRARDILRWLDSKAKP